MGTAADGGELSTEVRVFGAKKAKFLKKGSVLAADVFQLGEDAVQAVPWGRGRGSGGPGVAASGTGSGRGLTSGCRRGCLRSSKGREGVSWGSGRAGLWS